MKIKKIIFLTIVTIIALIAQCLAVNEIGTVNNEAESNIQNTVQENTKIEPNNNETQETNNNEQSNNTVQEIPQSNISEKPSSNTKTTESSNSSNSVQSKTKSSNADLKNLKLNVDGITPEFNSEVTEYTLIVDSDTEEVKVQAVPDDKNANVTINGNTNLVEGQNTIQIMVKAEDGTTKSYKINVTKRMESEETNAYLKLLNITGYSFYPTFNNKIYNYSLTINEKINNLEILAETEVDGATIEIEGNENLEEGENLIKIVVTSKNGEIKKEYKVNVFISTKEAEQFQVNKKQAYTLIGILAVAILITGILVVKNKK